jgi:Rrf2 family protein
MSRDRRPFYSIRELLVSGSAHHLSKVLQRLGKRGIVRSRRGVNGGFTLVRDPADLTLLDVWEALEGPFELDRCPLEKESCPISRCMFGGVLEEATKLIRDKFGSTTLAELSRTDLGTKKAKKKDKGA